MEINFGARLGVRRPEFLSSLQHLGSLSLAHRCQQTAVQIRMGKNKGGDKNAGGGGAGKGAKGKGDEKDSGKKKANGLNLKIRHILWWVQKKKDYDLGLFLDQKY